jgi:hypothetical protein
MGFKLVGNGAYLLASLMTQAPPLMFYLIGSSSQCGGGERAGTDYFALKLNASSQGVINCDCGG